MCLIRDHFIFGTSKRMSLRRAATKIQEHIAEADFLVTHSGAHDTEFLDSCGVSISGKLMFDTDSDPCYGVTSRRTTALQFEAVAGRLGN